MESDAEGRHPVQRRDVHSESGAQRIEADIYDGHHGKAAQPDPFDPPGGKIVPEGHEKLEEAEGVEAGFVDVPIPHWKDQITFRGLFVSLILGTAFSIITHRLNLTVGVIPSLNVAAGLLGYFMVASWTKVLKKLGFKCTPFTRQENTVIQTCVVACYGIAFSGGLGSYLLGMTSMAYDKLGDVPGNTVEDIKDLELGWIYAFTFVVSLLGIFVLVPLRKIMIIDYKLIYPSGTATAVLINSFHTPSGAVLARKQIRYLGKYFTFSFAWSFFKWFFSGIGGSCGFDTFPSLGLKAYANRFYFDFNMTYVGAGIICPHLVNCSVMFGAIISWGLLWPLIKTKEGDWYPEGLKEGSDFKGLFGYKVFICISIILGDGLYNFTKVTFIAVRGLYLEQRSRRATHNDGDLPEAVMLFDERRRNEVFQKDNVSPWIAVGGYVGLAIVSIIVIPILFSSVKWYYVIVAYLIAPIFAFCNAYGTGLTDWSLASNYGKLLLFVFAAWAGGGGGGILAGLAACGVMMSIVAVAADLMQDFKTGYMTLSSPRSMFVSQLVGAVMGCIIGPSTFWLYWTAFDIGAEGSLYQAPYAVIYRTMALIGVEGFGSLPRHCLQLCAGWFAFAMLVNAIRDKVPYKYSKYIPIPMAMAIPFYIGAYFAIDMFIGTCIVFAWEKVNRKKADTFSAAVASGLICGDGLWTIPAAILNFAKVDAPICMYFFRSKDPLLPG